MRRLFILFILLVVFATVLFFPNTHTLIFAQGTRQRRTTKVVTIPKEEVVSSDFIIKAGEVVEISGVVNGDVYAFGGQVLVDGVVNGDLIVGGGTINILGEVAQDARILGGQISINGRVGKNVTVIGGNIEIGNSADIFGGILAVAGNTQILGKVGGDVKVFSGNATVSNQIGGSLEANVQSLRLSSNAKIGKDLTYSSETEALIDESASVGGQIRRLSAPSVSYPTAQEVKELTKNIWAFRLGLRVISFLGAVLVGAIILKLFPRYSEAVSQIISERAGACLGKGFLVLILTPIAGFLLVVTVIGVPLAAIVFLIYFIFLYLSKIFVGFWIGAFVLKQKAQLSFWSFIVGLSIFYILTSAPFVGGLISMLALFMGLGAQSLVVRGLYLNSKKAKFI